MNLKKFALIVLSTAIIFSSAGCNQSNVKDKVDIRGQITEILNNDGGIVGILVEGKVEQDTAYDKARVKIGKETKIYDGNTDKQLSLNNLKEGLKVEVVFTGPVAESYPVQATARTIKIIASDEGLSESPKNSEAKVSDYFPLKKDVHMVYKGIGNEYAQYETYVDYIKESTVQVRHINPGTTSIFVYELKDGLLKKVYSRGETYYRHDYTSLRDDEEILIKEPIKPGTSWTLKDGTVRTITAVDKNISTPAGSFSAVEVTSKKPESTVIDYYAKDVGHVKRIFTSNNESNTVISELEKIESGVPFKHKVRFYYPEFLKDRIVYIDKDIEIFTNQDMDYKLQKELKAVPQDSGLSAVLTLNTQVQGIAVNDLTDTVTVDFSPHLIKEMNAGTSLESMLLKSIANTFGYYYQKNKVITTVDGKPYSSGHILMKPGEHFIVDPEDAIEFKAFE